MKVSELTEDKFQLTMQAVLDALNDPENGFSYDMDDDVNDEGKAGTYVSFQSASGQAVFSVDGNTLKLELIYDDDPDENSDYDWEITSEEDLKDVVSRIDDAIDSWLHHLPDDDRREEDEDGDDYDEDEFD